MSLLSCREVRKHFGGIRALDGVSLEVAEGEVVGMVGPNGSGKSTLINVLSGHFAADGGQVFLRGREITALPGHRIVEDGVARTYQIPRPFSSMTVLENVAVSFMFGRGRLGFPQARQRAEEWLEFVGLEDLAGDPTGRLNLHQLRFLELARALASEPQILFLDEVFAGLNPSEIDQSVSLVRRVHERGVTLVIVEHVMRVVTGICDRAVVLDQGRLIAEGEPHRVMEDPAVVTAYLGTKRRHA
jgi:branched-chain amino acid transport system permease protein